MELIRIKILTLFNKIFHKKSNKICIYGRAMLNDNNEALFNYLIKEKYNNTNKIILILKNKTKYKYLEKNKNVVICRNWLYTLYNLFTSKYIFHTHGMSKVSFSPKRGQIIFNLWHGSPLKAIGNMIKKKNELEIQYKHTDSYFLNASEFFKDINIKCYGHRPEQLFYGGNPRNDLLFENNNSLNKLNINKKEYFKVIMFLPTFRVSKDINRKDSIIEIPIITEKNIVEFNEKLKNEKIIMLIKLHPYQNDIQFLKEEFSNIKIYKNQDLENKKIKLYELLGEIDILLTDYSSVYFDFLITKKPLAFILDDFEEYKLKRGFTVENPLDIMPGEKIYTYNELLNFIEKIKNNIDLYDTEREKIANLTNKYQDSKNCKRIIDFVGIKK